jgi:hypothetical protein
MAWPADLMRSPGQTRTRPGDRQPAQRLLHIAYADGAGVSPTHYVCGQPVRRLIGTTSQGRGPRGGGVCPVCARLDQITRELAGLRRPAVAGQSR